MAEPQTTAMEAEEASNLTLKRDREAGRGGDEAAAKKAKLEAEVRLGPKGFVSAVEMFDYFIALLHAWAPHVDINKYEHMVLEDLLKKGHAEPNKKIGPGIQAFEIRNHPVWQSRCFFFRRVDGSADDFSFRKCVNSILPLPEDMKISNKSSDGKQSGGHQKGGRGRGGRGRGRGRGGN